MATGEVKVTLTAHTLSLALELLSVQFRMEAETARQQMLSAVGEQRVFWTGVYDAYTKVYRIMSDLAVEYKEMPDDPVAP